MINYLNMKRFLFVLSGAIAAFMASVAVNATSTPENLYVEQGTHSCLVRWDDDENSAWNLRYRLFTDEPDEPEVLNSLNGTTYTNQSYTAVTLSSPWSGNNVYGGYGAIYFRNASHQSATTDGYIKYTIPAGYENKTFTLNLTTANTQYGSGRFVVGSTQTASVQYNMSASETHSWTVTGSTGDVITITSPEDKYSPDIALIEVYYVPEKEWIYVYDLVKTWYNIEGLEMETDYEVQVQAIGDDGTLSDWTRPDVFTTLDEEPIIEEVHILGEVDGQEWAFDGGTKTEYNPATETYTATVHVEADKTFGFSTKIDPNGDLGGWNYVNLYRFGPAIDGEGPFDLTEDQLGKQLPLGWGWDNFTDFHVLVAGDYEITVSLQRNYVIIGKLEEPEHGYEVGDVNHDGKITIADATNLINYLLYNNANGVCLICADINGDTFVNISDVTELINILLFAQQ